MKKTILIFLSILVLITSGYAIIDNTSNSRFDLGYIAYNVSSNGNERGYGTWVSGLLTNLKARLGILDYDVSNPDIILISPETEYEDNDGRIDFKYKVLDNSSILNCFVYITELNKIEYQNNPSLDIENTITISGLDTNTEWRNWHINCTDIFLQSTITGTRKFKVLKTGVIEYGGRGGNETITYEEQPSITEKIPEKLKEPKLIILLSSVSILGMAVIIKGKIKKRSLAVMGFLGIGFSFLIQLKPEVWNRVKGAVKIDWGALNKESLKEAIKIDWSKTHIIVDNAKNSFMEMWTKILEAIKIENFNYKDAIKLDWDKINTFLNDSKQNFINIWDNLKDYLIDIGAKINPKNPLLAGVFIGGLFILLIYMLYKRWKKRD